MTREEAIKILMGYSYTPEERTALGTLLPEFRMSEDERIRRKMIEHFKAKTKETWCNMPVKDIIAYLEKQEIFSKGEGLYYYRPDGDCTFIGTGLGPIEDIKLNGERPKTENKGVDLPGACLCVEKLKENPKSTDSIPSDCTSDTKCKDRWHKVTDSLPDNPREVLCKDEAGNYLISRYYGDKGWVLNYDSISPVSEWVDFPSEKQKEQKPAEKSPMLKKLKEHLANTPREQLDAEFEALKDLTIDKPSEWSEEEKGKVVEYLHATNGRMLWSTATEITEDILDILRPQKLDASKLENFDPVDVLNRIKTEWPMAWEKVVGKQEWSEEDEEMINTLVSYVEDPSCWKLKCPREKLVAFIESLPKRFSPQPKQEWSEEETKDLVQILKVLDDCYAYGKHDLSKTDHDNLTSMIKSLRPSWKPSEEQIKYLLILADYFESEGGTSNAKTLREFSEDLRKLI